MRTKRQLDDPRALRDQASGAVVFVLAATGPEPRPLPGPALVALLDAIGVAETTARATILRMRRAGWLTSERRGPVVEYRLTDPAKTLAASVLVPLAGPRPPWTGRFQGLLFSVPERHRGYRDALRRAATVAGFGLLQGGLLIAVEEERWSRIQPLIDRAPADSRLIRTELRLSLDDARTAAAAAWPLEALGATYRQQAADVQRLVSDFSASAPTGAAAVRLMWEAMRPMSATAIDDPALPAELLPTDWPTAEIQAAIVAVGTVIGARITAFIDERIAAARGAT
jgi:DNA-binding transcriptional regulator PaaX